MVSKVFSVAVNGLSGALVEIEAHLSRGQPAVVVVWLPDVAVQESRDRVRSAIKNSGFSFWQYRTTINLAPADIRKRWPSFDLPIAIGMVAHDCEFDPHILEKSLFIGELALDGRLRSVSGILPTVLFAVEHGYEYVFVPQENAEEASLVPGVRIVALETLKDAVAYLSWEKTIPVVPSVNIETFVRSHNPIEDAFDFRNIIGQDHAKRALLLAAAGGHNILLEGPPGSWKTMLARALSTILPTMTFTEVVEVSKIYSVAGLLSKQKPLISDRPFRKIHHTASTMSIIGGGRDSRPGEISLAHKGILFLDEFLEFDTRLIETLRQPIEDGEITINRVNATYRYPAKFTLVGALNPCPCWFLGDREKQCVCSQGAVERYRSKLSGPILDRVDLFIHVPRVKIEDFEAKKKTQTITSESLRSLVFGARERQKTRFVGTTKTYNSEMTNEDVDRFCVLGKDEDVFVKNAVSRLDLSTRAYFRLLKLARTIADIEGSDDIRLPHLAEALGYRKIDDKK